MRSTKVPSFTAGEARSLYVHFPFCERKCHYCDFYSIARVNENSRALAFEECLKIEAASLERFLAPTLETVFFGGGTPSLTSAASMRHALSPVFEKIQANQGCLEWTMEANPSSLNRDSLREYRELGINRLSMGIQSLEPALLEVLGRVHSREQALRALEDVFETGFSNVSVDLLCGVPGQSTRHLENSLTELMRFPITHLSCYILTLAPGNPLFNELPEEEEQLEHYLWLHDRMTGFGFEHYEISNFSRPGYRAKHNLNYWNGRSYLGLGPSAHSHDASAAMRWKNASSLESYCYSTQSKGHSVEWTEHLSEDQKNLERWMLSLRTDEGIPDEWLDTALRNECAARLEKAGLLESHPHCKNRKRLTAKGFAIADQVVSALA